MAIHDPCKLCTYKWNFILQKCAGGKSPLIIFDDVDVDDAAQLAHDAILVNNMGQSCSAASRTFVQEGIYDKFVAKSKELAEELKEETGAAFGGFGSPDPENGPLISESQMKKVLDYVDSGVKEGAQLVSGGHRIGDRGYFVAPTVFAGVTDKMRIAREEIFGPVEARSSHILLCSFVAALYTSLIHVNVMY